MTLIVNNTTIDSIIVRDRTSGVETPLDLFQDSNGVEIWAGFIKLRQLIDRSIESVTAEDLEGIVTIRSYALYYADKLKSVQLPDTCTSVDDYAFEYCSGLEELDVGNTVYSLGEYSFAYCSNLKKINLRNVTELDSRTFANCTSLTNIELPEGIKSLHLASFENCTGLTYIKIPATVTYFDMGVFGGCTNLTTIRFLSTTPPSFASGSNAPEGLTRIEVPSGSLSDYQTKAEYTNYEQLMVGV